MVALLIAPTFSSGDMRDGLGLVPEVVAAGRTMPRRTDCSPHSDAACAVLMTVPRDPELTHGFHCPEGPGLGPFQALDQLSFIDDITGEFAVAYAIVHYLTANGYRVYHAIAGREIVLLLCGGDKRSQTSDITKACEYRRDFQRRRDDEK